MSLEHSQNKITKNTTIFIYLSAKQGKPNPFFYKWIKEKTQPPQTQSPPLTVTKDSKADLRFKHFQIQISFCKVGTDFQILSSFWKKYLKYTMLFLHFFTPWSMCNVGK